MKKYLSLFTLCLILLASCKKSPDANPAVTSNTITATIDGVDEIFSDNIIANMISLNASNSQFIGSAYYTGTTEVNKMGISLQLNKSVTVGSYTSGNSTIIGYVAITYNQMPLSGASPLLYNNDVNSTENTITVTTLTSTNIQGTFNGKVYYKGAVKTVTNGRFNLSLH